MTQQWRGYVNTLIYGLDLTRPPDDTVVTELVDELIAQQVFNEPVEEFYRAAVAALASEVDLATFEYTSDAAVRVLLDRAVTLLDERRPWPEPPFYSFHPPQWSELLGEAPLIGRVALGRRQLEERLNRPFTRVTLPLEPHATVDNPPDGMADGDTDPDPRKVDILILRLRGGHLIGLKIDPANPEEVTDVHAGGGSTTTVAALRELAGIDVQPAISNPRR